MAVFQLKGEPDMVLCFALPNLVPELVTVIVQTLFKVVRASSAVHVFLSLQTRKVININVTSNVTYIHKALKVLKVERGSIAQPKFEKSPSKYTSKCYSYYMEYLLG